MQVLTIVHVGCFPTGLHPYPDYGVYIKLKNGLVREGHMVLGFSDRDVARAKSLFGSRKFGGRGAVNRSLAAFCRAHRPDVLLLGHADMITADTLRTIRDDNPGIRIGQWNVDALFQPDNVQRIRSKIDAVDVTFVSTAGAALNRLRDGRYAVSFMPNPTDASIESGQVDMIERPDYDLFYACGSPERTLRRVCGTDWNMNDFIDRISAALPDLRLGLAGIHNTPYLKDAAYRAAVRSSAIGLNISRRSDDFLYSSDRIAQLAGNGCVVAIEREVGYDTYFGEDEMLFFSTMDELIGKLDHLSHHPRARMAMGAAGRLKYRQKFNERAVAAHILAVLAGQRAPEAMPW